MAIPLGFAEFLAYFPKNGNRLMRLPLCLCVCLSPHQLLNHFIDFHEIWQGGDAIEGDLSTIILIPYLQSF